MSGDGPVADRPGSESQADAAGQADAAQADAAQADAAGQADAAQADAAGQAHAGAGHGELIEDETPQPLVIRKRGRRVSTEPTPGYTGEPATERKQSSENDARLWDDLPPHWGKR